VLKYLIKKNNIQIQIQILKKKIRIDAFKYLLAIFFYKTSNHQLFLRNFLFYIYFVDHFTQCIIIKGLSD